MLDATTISVYLSHQVAYIVAFAVIELAAMFFINKYFTPTEVPHEKRSSFVRDILCIPISLALWMLACDTCIALYRSDELRWFGTTDNSYYFLLLYVSHNIVQVRLMHASDVLCVLLPAAVC